MICLLIVFALLSAESGSSFHLRWDTHSDDTLSLESLTNSLNKYRSMIASGHTHLDTGSNIQQLVWDPSLAERASHVSVCENIRRPYNDILSEVMDNQLGFTFGFESSRRSMERIIRDWFSEGKNYDSLIYACLPDKHCENFMQLGLASVDRVGCASSRCELDGSGLVTLACVYPISFITVTQELALPLFSQGAPCTRCPAHASFCHQGLCVPCNRVDSHQCECSKTCGQVTGDDVIYGWGYLDRATCSCKCEFGFGPNCDEPCSDQGPGCPKPDEEDKAETCATFISEFCPASCGLCRPMLGSENGFLLPF